MEAAPLGEALGTPGTTTAEAAEAVLVGEGRSLAGMAFLVRALPGAPATTAGGRAGDLCR